MVSSRQSRTIGLRTTAACGAMRPNYRCFWEPKKTRPGTMQNFVGNPQIPIREPPKSRREPTAFFDPRQIIASQVPSISSFPFSVSKPNRVGRRMRISQRTLRLPLRTPREMISREAEMNAKLGKAGKLSPCLPKKTLIRYCIYATIAHMEEISQFERQRI